MAGKSILNLSEIEDNNWGAEYYHPNKLLAIKKLSKFNNKISKHFSSIKKSYAIKEDDRIINLGNVNRGFIQDVSEEKSVSNKKLAKKGDILISKLRPYLEEISLVSYKFDKSYISTEFIILRNKEDIKEQIFALLPFLFTKEVQTILFWSQQGTNHPRFNEKVLLNLDFPELDKNILEKFKERISLAYDCYNKSVEIYKKAESKLDDYFEFDKLKKINKKFSIRKLSETKISERFDADFYQEKYDAMFKIMSDKSNIDELGKLVKIQKGIEVGEDEYCEQGVPFIRVSSVSKFEITNNDVRFISDKTYSLYKEKFRPKKGDILLTKDATLGTALLINNDIDALISSGVLRLKIEKKGLRQEYLALVLNSSLVHFQIEKYAGGSIITHWRPDIIKKTLIPLIEDKKQEELAEMVSESYCLIEKAKKLLTETINEIQNIVND